MADTTRVKAKSSKYKKTLWGSLLSLFLGLIVPIHSFAIDSNFAIDNNILQILFVDGKPVNHYKILRISANATEEEIKKAYRKRAMETHPDRHPELEEEFKKVKRAYEVLSDKDRKALYHQAIADFYKSNNAGQGATASNRHTSTGPKNYKKWNWATNSPEGAEAPEVPRESKQGKTTQQQSQSTARRTYAEQATNFYERTQEASDPLAKISTELKTSDGKIWNYFAIAGIRGTAGPKETEEAIAIKYEQLKMNKKLARTSAELAEATVRLERLEMAKKVLLTPRLKQLYLDETARIFVKDPATGFRQRYSEVLHDFIPEKEITRQQTGATASRGACKSWFSRLF